MFLCNAQRLIGLEVHIFTCISCRFTKGAFSYDAVLVGSCPTGTYFNTTVAECRYCPVGTYQNVDGSMFCHECPGELSTKREGARSVDECVGTYKSNRWLCR